MVRDTRFLRAFYAVCTEGGFGRAAARLHCTQPAISYQVRALERDVGAPLFERGGRRAVLTPAGRRLREFCRRYFAEFAQLTAEVLRQVEEGEVDLGVVYLTKVSNYLAFRALREEELALIAAPSLARELAARDLARLDTYEAVPFVTYLEGDYVFGRWFDTHFGAQPARTASVHHFDELEEVIAMVALGSGTSVVPLDGARAAVQRRAVRVIRPVRGRRCVNQVFAVTRAGAFVRPELEAILATLAA